EKMKAVLDEIERVHALGRPMLVGTASVERSEQLSEYLNRRGVPHDVLNAKNHGREASIVAFAGFLRHVTVATNMAGRGTDILLGPAPAEISDLEPVVEWIGSVFWKKGMKRLRFADFSKLEFEDARKRLVEHVDTFVNEAIDAWTAQTKAPLSRTALAEVDQVGMRKVLASALKQVGIKDEVQVYNLTEPLVTLVQAGKNVHNNFKGGIALMGGLHVLGTERHESRRIDNQLRGRCGRQGDPGSSQFFLSLQDDLMRIFAPDRVSRILERLGMTEGQEISHGMVSRAIGRAQQKVEARNFDIRKNLLEYDGVMDEQRKVIYQQRQAILEGADTKAMVLDMVEEASEEAVENYASDEIIPAERDYEGLADWVKNRFDYEVAADELKSKSAEEIEALLMERARALHHERESVLGAAGMRTLERFLMLQKIDEKWKDHLAGMDQLRSGVGLHGYAQEDPKIIYKKRGFEAFQAMLNAIQEDVTSLLYRVRLVTPEEERRLLGRTWGSGTQMSGPAKTSEGGGPSPKRGPARSGSDDKTAADEGARAAARAMQRQQRRDTAKPQTNQPEVKEPVRVGPKVGRNEPCPCGSGKKFKRCCGK
ncbi:MAG: preprotein translocase subunit SecA, partial [Planctomycetota bacterium]